MSKFRNRLLVTNSGWYLNGKYILTIDEVKSELIHLPKDYLEFVACSQTEYDLFVKTMDIVHQLKISNLQINSDFTSPLCK